MKVSYNWLQTYFKDPLPEASELSELFTKHAFEVESLEENGNDKIFDVKILPDRAHYLLSHRGIAREIRSITEREMETQETSYTLNKPESSPLSVRIEDEDLCRRYIAALIDGIDVSDSPEWLKERLQAVGQRSINNLVDAGNFVMLDMGQPLHIFDADKVRGSIIVRRALEGETMTLLTGNEIKLSNSDLVIADVEGPLALAGVKGGKRAEVNENTKRIIIESANFSPSAIRRSSTKLNLRNDASKRFENEITPALARGATADIISLLLKLLPKAKLIDIVDVYPEPVKSWEIRMSQRYVSELLGIEVEKEKVKKILNLMGCTVTEDGEELVVVPPMDRLDMKGAEDVVDEIGRIVSYEDLQSVLPPGLEEKLPPAKDFYYSERVKNILVELGYSEAILYSLVSKGNYEVAYPLASDKSALRPSLREKLSDALLVNSRNAEYLNLDVVKMFEVGKVFKPEGERLSLALGVKIIKKQKGVNAESIITESLKVIEKDLGIAILSDLTSGEYGTVAEVDFESLIASLDDKISIADLHFEPLPREKRYEKFSPYPFMVRDVAVFIPEATDESSVHGIIQELAGPLCIKSWLFDVFSKEGRKSCAFRLIFQSFDKTLEDSEVNPIMESIYSKLNSVSGWETR